MSSISFVHMKSSAPNEDFWGSQQLNTKPEKLQEGANRRKAVSEDNSASIFHKIDRICRFGWAQQELVTTHHAGKTYFAGKCTP